MGEQNLNHSIQVKDILPIIEGRLITGNENQTCENFSKDSRECKEGDIYLGIKGETTNGSIYFENAFQNGAIGAIVQDIEISEEQKTKYQDKCIILVEDTIKAMQAIATYKRSLYEIPVIAITGSVGKTSTKDMVASVVKEKYTTIKTEGNYNNHIGVPLTIFHLKEEKALVVEMGMNHLGELSVLTKIAKPNVAIITNVGTAHIGNLGSRENILKAKLEILEGLKPGGTVILNNDNDLLHNWYLENKEKFHIITYGIENESDYMAEDIIAKEDGSNYVLKGTEEKVEVPVGGNHFVQNSLCAIAVGKLLQIPFEKIREGISTFELTKKRMDVREHNNITIIHDYYNANYDSMKAGLEYLGNIKGKRKIAVLGDMLELGDYSEKLHQKVGEEVIKNRIDILITVGKEAKAIAEMAKRELKTVIICDTNEEAIKQINQIKEKKDCILLKASNGMHFGEIGEEIEK